MPRYFPRIVTGMRRRLGWVLVAGAIALTACSKKPVTVAEGGRGAAISYTCLGCHGIPNYKNAYPNYSVPKLTGQHPDYLVLALQAYRSGERAHATMHAQASELSDQDMKDIAMFFGGEPLKSDGAQGTSPDAAQTCVACHGTDGVSITPMYPTLAGQHADYLARALLDYKEGTRKNPIMANFAQQLSREQIEQLATYYARQKPALATVEANLSAAR
jgi:cytochrome c553